MREDEKNWVLVMIFLLLIFAFGLVKSNKAAGAEIRVSTGQTTLLRSIAHTDSGDRYSINALGVRFDNNFELSIIEHEYHIRGERDFSTMSFGVVKHWTLERGIFFLDGGLGLRYTEKDKRIKWLRHKSLMADFSGAIGLKLGEHFKASVGLRHFSCPGSDTGINVDEISIVFRRAF